MELRALILLPLCFPGLQGQTSEAQRRREGGTLYIQCPYAQRATTEETKFWCLLKDRACQERVNTYNEWRQKSKDGRTQIRDDTTNRTVSITMTDLKAEDSGTYFCAYHTYQYGTSVYIQLRIISLNVFQELLRWELDTLLVQCPAWCRRGQCTVERKTSSSRITTKSLQDRAAIHYDGQGAPIVTVRQLQTRDSGVYWCALGSERTTEIVLSVHKRTQQRTAEESGTVSVQCHYRIADYASATKAWCRKEGETCRVLATTGSEPPAANGTARAGVSVRDDSQQGIVTVTMAQLQPQDSGVYWCALQERAALSRMEEVTLSVSRALPPGGSPDTERRSQDILLGEPSSSTFIIVTVVLFILLLLALITSTALGVRYYKLLARTGNREAEDTRDRSEGTAQPGSSGRRKSSQDDSQGSGYINLDVQSHPSPEDPLYCNVEPSQAARSPPGVEYALIAFSRPQEQQGMSPRQT